MGRSRNALEHGPLTLRALLEWVDYAGATVYGGLLKISSNP